MFADFIISRVTRRKPDFIIGGDVPYLNRWWVIPRNKFFNTYLHQFIRDDDDRALHDHPWWSLSWLMRGALWEFSNKYPRRINAGSWRLRSAHFAHKLKIPDRDREKTWTLFITGPVIREWGFHCQQGWRHWKEFTDTRDKGSVGKGCA